jgi:hypothetical protein
VKAPAWHERDTKQAAQEGEALQQRLNWRKVTITADPISGKMVVEFGSLKGGADVKLYSPSEFVKQGQDIARLIGFHVTP